MLRFILSSENKRRDVEQRDDSYDDIYVKEQLADGTQTEKRVDKVRLMLGLRWGDDLITTRL